MDSFSLTIAGMLLYVLLAWAILQFIGSQRKARVSLHLDKRVAQTELAFDSARTHFQQVSKMMMGELVATETGKDMLTGDNASLHRFLQPYFERWQQVDDIRVYGAEGELRNRFLRGGNDSDAGGGSSSAAAVRTKGEMAWSFEDSGAGLALQFAFPVVSEEELATVTEFRFGEERVW